jgi:hypothetical protein
MAVNYAPNQSQCYVRLPFTDLGSERWRLEDLISGVTYERLGADLHASGLYLDEPPGRAAVFTLSKQSESPARTCSEAQTLRQFRRIIEPAGS